MNLKHVLIDFERLKYPNCGLGQYSLNLARELGQQLSPNLRATYLVPKPLVGQFGATPNYLPVRSYFKKIRFTLPKADLWHSTHQDSEYGPRSSKAKILLTIHDLNFLTEKVPVKAQARLQDLQHKVNGAAAITTVSEFTAQEVRQHLDLRGKPLHVIYNGVDLSHLEHAPISECPKWAPEAPFFLALGVVTRKKNFHVLIEMMRHFPEYDLVIAGFHDRQYVPQIHREIEKFGLEHQIILPGEVSGGIKTWLFQNCAMFLFPSLLEGFGIPVAEAMSYGKPVVCSNLCSLPEVGGDQAYYWRDFKAESMAQVAQQCWQDFQKNPREKAQSLIAQAKKFTWARAASKYIEVYQKTLE